MRKQSTPKSVNVLLVLFLYTVSACNNSTQWGPSPTPGSALSLVTKSPVAQTTLLPDVQLIRETKVLELLKTNLGCDFPCWWGIMPGQTTWDGVLRLFKDLEIDVNLHSESGEIKVYEAHIDLSDQYTYVELVFRVQNDVVEAIQIKTYTVQDSSGEFNLGHYYQSWGNYSPSQMIIKYGQPDLALISPSNRDTSVEEYGLLFFYDKARIMASYHGLMNGDEIYNICPGFRKAGQIISLSLLLIDPASQLPFEKYTNDAIQPGENLRSLDEASGLSLEQIYTLFMQGQENMCFTTNRDLWPHSQ